MRCKVADWGNLGFTAHTHTLVAVGHSLDRQRPRKGFPTQQSVSAFLSFLQNDPPLFQNLGPFISPNTVSVCAILGKWLARPSNHSSCVL